MKLSLVIITKNEEKNIKACLDSVPFADEVIVVDSGSTDKTKELAITAGAKFIFNKWPGYGKQKQFAIDQASHDWVLLLDADEYLCKDLQSEIQSILTEPKFDAYRIPRQQIFMNRECRYGKSVDHPLRLVNRKKGQFDLKEIHESFVTTGTVSDLKAHMMHNSGITVAHRWEKIMRDVRLDYLNNENPDIGLSHVLIVPARYFLNYYIKKEGYRDGFPGFIMTTLFTFQIFLQNVAQYKKKLSKLFR